MNLIDKITDCRSRGEVLPLKGKIKVTLEDVRDGSQEIVESENIQTNAVKSIFEHNWNSSTDFKSLLPLRQLYGGVMCFQEPITEQANNYNPSSELENPLIAHAGTEAPPSGYTNKKRGVPVAQDFILTDTSIKQVWLWDNVSGNGTINTVCLCPDSLGNSGLTPSDTPASLLSALSYSGAYPYQGTISEEVGREFPISIASDGKTAKALWLNGNSFSEATIRHDYLAFGIMRTNADFQEVAKRTATVRTFTVAKTSVFEDADYYWIYEIYNDNQHDASLKIDKVKKSDFTVEQADISYDGVFITASDIGNANKPFNIMCPRFAYDGHYLYLPNSQNNGFVALNPSDNSDKFALDNSIIVAVGVGGRTGANVGISPIVISEGLIYGNNYLINGSKVYQFGETINLNGSTGSNLDGQAHIDVIRHGASVYGSGNQWYYGGYYGGQGSLLLKLFLSTISVLPEAKTKTTSQTMRIEYTSSENV